MICYCHVLVVTIYGVGIGNRILATHNCNSLRRVTQLYYKNESRNSDGQSASLP
jgi:hypothetical protein